MIKTMPRSGALPGEGGISLLRFLRQEPTFCISFAAAVLSCFLVPPDAAYPGYLDWRTLSLLYSLMVVVAGLRSAGSFAVLAHVLCQKASTVRTMAMVLVGLCFFSSMLITNDVALLTFVPFAVVVLGMAGREKELLRLVVLQTVAANLGSMLTPVGNPQNLHLFSRYHMEAGQFLSVTAPVWLASLLLLTGLCLRFPREGFPLFLGEKPTLDRRKLTVHLLLFALCLPVVFRLMHWGLLLAVLIPVLLLCDRKSLLQADFLLLLTFVCFFVFSGNLARIGAVRRLLGGLLAGHELLLSALCSQFISNVPAALLLSGFTEQAPALLLGVNIGGLGTPVASLASLISLKLYSHSQHADLPAFLRKFCAVNFLLLALLLMLGSLLV